jgi:hypothetical protein
VVVWPSITRSIATFSIASNAAARNIDQPSRGPTPARRSIPRRPKRSAAIVQPTARKIE